MTDFDSYHVPQRRQIGGSIQPLTRISHEPLPLRQQRNTPSHAHARTVSSNVFPMHVPPAPSNTYTQTVSHSRRTPSTATTSTISSQGGPHRTTSSVSVSLRRSGSARSGQSVTATSYVALMRKQKATVWCDRSQQQDPRMLEKAKEAKRRATQEVVVGNMAGRTSTSGSIGGTGLGMRSKITNRHHGAPKAVSYSANLLGTTGVPMRLSASEVGDEVESSDDADSQRVYNQRTGSGRSSLASGQRLTAFSQRPPGRLSTGSTPPNGQGTSPSDRPQDTDTPVADQNQARASGEDYFQHSPGNGGSGSSGEGESSFGNIGDMKAPDSSVTRKEKEGKSAEELSRRGSVDERAATMRGAVRLFVANPDLSD